MNEQTFTNMEKIAEGVRLAKEGNHPVVAFNGGETERFEDTTPSPHYFAPIVRSCVYEDIPFLMGDFSTPSKSHDGLYETNFAEDHALLYRTKEFQTTLLMHPSCECNSISGSRDSHKPCHSIAREGNVFPRGCC